ncbi:hypothetical protein ElyMa_006607700 [Elysia marginata]|uniref:Uncharacterized protein n=1 Tax=Elysia marginata TaxID=1093978 RepID=A0AAV4IFU7_9GAST|nr:hypothetical protein ElyMa_006607700 [Elysia marginata]
MLAHCERCIHYTQSHYPDTGPTRLSTKSIKLTIHAGVRLRVVPGIRTRIQIARSLVTIHTEIRTRVAPGQGESPKFPRPCHQLYRGRGIP